MPTPDQFGLHYENIELTAQDGVKLRCYLLQQAKDLPQPEAVGVGLIRVRPGDEEAYAERMCELVRNRFPEQPGFITAGVYQDRAAPRQFLIRNTWETAEALSAHQRWITHALFPLTDPLVERREILALLLHWSYQQAPASAGAAVSA